MNSCLDDLFREVEKKDPVCKCVARLTTSCWSDKDGLCIKKTLRYLKKKCVGFNFLEEDVSMIGANETIDNIINLGECKDGVYEVITCNVRTDWETGTIDDWDYKLIPYEECLSKE